MKYCCKEHFWRDRQPCLKERSDAQACVRLSTKLSIFARDISFRSEQFSSAQRAQRKFRMEPGRSAAKLALCKEILLQQIAQRSDNATLSSSCQTNQLRSSSLLLGTLSHGAHEPISIALRTRFLDAPADDSGHSFAKIAIPCTILPLAQFTCLLINQHCSADLL